MKCGGIGRGPPKLSRAAPQQQVGPIRCQPASSGTSLVQLPPKLQGTGAFFIWKGSPGSGRMGVLAGSGISTLKLEGVATWSLPVLRRTGLRYITMSCGHRIDIYDELPPPHHSPSHLSACSKAGLCFRPGRGKDTDSPIGSMNKVIG